MRTPSLSGVLFVALLGCGGPHQQTADPGTLEAFVRGELEVTSFKSAEFDLNGGGEPETLVYATDQNRCGTGGCALFVLTEGDGRYQLISRTTIVKLPLRVLDTSTNGWRDLAVTVSGGGVLTPYVARLPFDGTGYTANPSMPPASPVEDVEGQILIGG